MILCLHTCTIYIHSGGLVEYFHCNNSIKCNYNVWHNDYSKIECLYIKLKVPTFKLTYTYMYDSNYVYVICILLIMCRGDYLIKKSLMCSMQNPGNKVAKSNVITLNININFIGVVLSQIYFTYIIEYVKKRLICYCI